MDMVPEPSGSVGLEECLTRCAAAGFQVFDLNLCDQGLPGRYLASDDWEEETRRLKELAQTLGIQFSQSHLEFYNVCDQNAERREWREELVRRGIIASGRLGVKWAVYHAGSVYDHLDYSYAKSREANLEYVKPHLELAARAGIGLAVENVPDKEKRRFSGSAEELIDLVDTVNQKNFGICWDFGHAHLAGIDQPYWLRRIGSRLKAVHIADNNGEWDEHLAPFYGTIDWTAMMRTLKQIGYQNDLTYEIHNMTRRLPDKLREVQLKHLIEIGQYLRQIYETAE
jgi:sugar phosphate isomerase/epimerase